MAVGRRSVQRSGHGTVADDGAANRGLCRGERSHDPGNQTGAADALIAVIEDPNWAMFEGEAHARLAVQLNKLDLPYAALLAYAKAMAADPEGVGSEAGKAVDLADKVGDQAVLEPVFAKNLGLDVDDATRSRMAYLAARENHRAGQLATAAAILKLVKPNDPYYPEAKALEGVILSLQKRHGDALARSRLRWRSAAELSGRTLPTSFR